MQGTITKTKLKGGRISWGYVHDAGRDANGKRIQIARRGFKFKKDAEDALRDAIPADSRDSNVVRKDHRPFEVVFNMWLEQHGATHWGKATAESNTKRAGYAIRMFGMVPVQMLTSMRLERDFATMLAKGGRKTKQHPDGGPLSPKTVREIAALVSQALDKAVKWKLIEKNPMVDVDRPTAHEKEVQILEPEQYEAYLNRVQGTRYYALSVFAADAGCRRGELLALTWKDIDLNSGMVAISKSLSETKDGLEIKTPKSRKSGSSVYPEARLRSYWITGCDSRKSSGYMAPTISGTISCSQLPRAISTSRRR